MAASGTTMHAAWALQASGARLIEVLAAQAEAMQLHRSGDAADVLLEHLMRHIEVEHDLPRSAWATPIVRCHHAGLIDLTTLRKAAKAGRVYWAQAASPLTRALHDRGDLVIAAEGESAKVCALPAGMYTTSPARAPASQG